MSPLLIDTDPGIDDALALLYAFGTPGCDIVGLTTVAGNVEVDRATANAHRIVDVAGAAPLPIVPGAAAPLRRVLTTAKHYHGDDGLAGHGGVDVPPGAPRGPDLP